MQDYNFILQHIPGKINMKADDLSGKNQVNTMDNNKDVKLLKNELYTRQDNMEAEMIIIRGKQVVEETTLLEKIRRN